MTDREEELAVLTRGLDQVADLLGEVTPEHLTATTPCAQWEGAALVDHMAVTPGRFARIMRGEQVDWAAAPDSGDDPVATFRVGRDELLEAWRTGGEVSMGPDWMSAEVAVHTYDLATTVGRPTADLDPEVAERGLAFMRATLKPEMRGEAFEPEQPAPDGADAYQRIAAFAGRTVARGGE
jgi:uncharacterized protein (TIGR03086 family)